MTIQSKAIKIKPMKPSPALQAILDGQTKRKIVGVQSFDVPITFARIRTPQIVERIDQIVGAHYDLSPDELRHNTRMAHIVWPRQVCMWLLRRNSNWSYKRIAEAYSGLSGTMNHATAMHAVKHVNEQISCDPVTASLIQYFEMKVGRVTQQQDKP